MADWRIVVRNTALTESDAPATAIATRPAHRAWDFDSAPSAASMATPKPAIAKPHPTMLTRIASPCRRTWPSRPENAMATMPPTAAAALRAPTVFAPPPKITAPAAGKRTRGWASSMATMSAMKVIRTFGRVARKANPSSTERRPGRLAPEPSWCGSGGRGRSRARPHSAPVVISASRV